MERVRRTIPRIVADRFNGDATEAEKLVKEDSLIKEIIYSSMP